MEAEADVDAGWLRLYLEELALLVVVVVVRS